MSEREEKTLQHQTFHGSLEIDGVQCHYKMSIGSTDLYKAENGKEYVVNPHLGAIDIADLLRWPSSWKHTTR